MIDALVFGLGALADALFAWTFFCAFVGAIALVYHAPGLYRRRQLRRSPWHTALRHSIRRTA